MSLKFYLFAVLFVVLIPSIIFSVASYFYFKDKYQKEMTTDITRDQMFASEERVKDFLAKHDLRPGDSIDCIAKVLNVSKGKVDPDLDKMASLREVAPGGSFVVDFGPGQSSESIRFNFAHECGHLINGDKAPVDNPGGHGKSEADQLADYVAAALLMPFEEVADFLIENKYKSACKGKCLRLTQQLGAKYGVEEITVLRRIKEVYTLLPDANLS